MFGEVKAIMICPRNGRWAEIYGALECKAALRGGGWTRFVCGEREDPRGGSRARRV